MPLSRSNTTSRSRSRSPAPTAPMLSSIQSPRPFLPPSHYAAAGGIPLPDKSKSSGHFNSPASISCQDGYSPSSFLAPDSDSFEGRTPTDSHIILESPRSPSLSALKRRQSQYSNLPLVEAQLLPSLRDTIDRMTRPPSQAACASPIPAPTTPTLRISHDDYMDTPSPYPFSSRPRTPLVPDNSSQGHGGERPSTPKVPSVRSTPKSTLKSALRTPSSSKLSSKSEDHPNNIQNTNTLSHSPVVGSTLRSVKSLLRRKSSSSSVAAASEKEKRSSKENAKPIQHSFTIFRTPTPTPSSSHAYSSTTPPASASGSGTRSRSRTDPGTAQYRESTFHSLSKLDHRMPTTPQPSVPSAFASNLSREKQSHSQTTSKSNIPRFHVYHRGNSGASGGGGGGGVAVGRKVATDDSDTEYRYELDSRDRRKLMVINAEVIPSSSGSEGEGEAGTEVEEDSVVFNGFSDDLQSNSSLDMRSMQKLGLIGLGFRQSHVGNYDRDLKDGSGDVVESDLEGNLDPDAGIEEGMLKTPRDFKDARASVRTSVYSMASYQSEGSIYTDDYKDEDDGEVGVDHEGDFSENEGQSVSQDSHQHLGEQKESETRRRRRTALLGLVDGLHMDKNSNPARRQSHGQSDVETDYCGEDGVAVSLSNETGLEDLEAEVEVQGFGQDLTWGEQDAHQPPRNKAKVRDFRKTAIQALRETHSPSSSHERRATGVPSKNTISKETATLRDKNRRATIIHKAGGDGSGSKIPSASSGTSKIPSPSPRNIVSLEDREKRFSSARSPRPPHVPTASPLTSRDDNDHRKPLTAHQQHMSDLSRAISPSLNRSTVITSPTNSSSNTTSNRDSSNAFEAVMIAKKSREAAARNLKAWGIPPSESDQVHVRNFDNGWGSRDTKTQTRMDGRLLGNGNGSGTDGVDGGGTLPVTESVTSSVENLKGSWEQVNDANEEELSHGAEKLFRTLSGRERGRRRDKERSGLANSGARPRSVTPTTKSSKESQRKSESKPEGNQRETNVSRSQSCPRPRTEGNDIGERPLTACEQIVARYNTDNSGNGGGNLSSEGEQQSRLDIITELYDVENVFVNRLLSVVNLFILPLRVQETKMWISGVPLEIAKMLDWFEDIVNLHVELRQTLHGIKVNLASAANPTMEPMADSLRAFVKKLEVYQPYLVRMGKVRDMLDRLARDETSDFGEFVRIQENGDGDGREDGTLVKLLMEPMERLGAYHRLFKRLLDATPKTHQDYLATFTLLRSTGLVIKALNEVKKREEEYEYVKTLSQRIDGLPLSAQLARRERRLLCQGPLLQEVQVQGEDSTTPVPKISRMSRLINAINEGRGRSGSTSSSCTGVSFRSTGTMNSPPPIPLQILVFSDLVIFATARARRENQEQGTERWSLCPDAGICRIIDVVETESSDAASKGPLITLDVVPVGFEHNQDVLAENSVIKTFHLRIPEPHQPLSSSSSSSVPSRQLWNHSFKRSLQSTLRSLSDPRCSQECLIDGPNRLLEYDRKRILNSILTSGLPFPKSPSLQEASLRMGTGEGEYDYDTIGDPTTTKLEREERGWWSLRFRQVLHELLHEDGPNSFEVLVPDSSVQGF